VQATGRPTSQAKTRNGDVGGPAALVAGALVLALPVPALAGVGVIERAWPGGVVPYRLDPSLTAADRAAITKAAAAWRRAVGPRLRFVEVGDERAKGLVLRIVRPASADGRNRCRATVGADRSARPLALAPEEVLEPPAPASGWLVLSGRCSYRSLVHEFGHVLGLEHEHQRADRDRWLSFKLLREASDAATLATWSRNYAVRVRTPAVGGPGTTIVDGRVLTRDYDPCSIMQYLEDPLHARRGIALAFTAEARRYAERTGCRLGGSGGAISTGDATTVRALYEG
jgi:hypothetical protein